MNHPQDVSQFDPCAFNDPLAEKTEWTSLMRCSSDNRTHKLVEKNPYRLEFQTLFRWKFPCLFFLVLGLATLLFGLFMFFLLWLAVFALSQTDDALLGLLFGFILVLTGVIFTVGGGLSLYARTHPIVFDTQARYFWKGRRSPERAEDIKAIGTCIELDMIHALQFLGRQRIPENLGGISSYEINLVLRDGLRMNVVHHGDSITLREEANMLSERLNKPLWDATRQSQ